MLIYDSTNPLDIPADVEGVAGYIDGVYGPEHFLYGQAGWDVASWDRFATSAKIRIAVNPFTDDGDALDVENGDATPAQAPVWVQRRRAAGILRPWVYCNRSNRPAVEAALAAAGILGDQACLWVATLDGTESVPGGPYPVAAVQYANSTIAGGHYDISSANATFGPRGGSLGAEMDQATFDALVQNNPQLGALGYAARLIYALGITYHPGQPNLETSARIADILGAIKAIPTSGGAALTPAQAQLLQETHDAIQRIEAAFKAA